MRKTTIILTFALSLFLCACGSAAQSETELVVTELTEAETPVESPAPTERVIEEIFIDVNNFSTYFEPCDFVTGEYYDAEGLKNMERWERTYALKDEYKASFEGVGEPLEAKFSFIIRSRSGADEMVIDFEQHTGYNKELETTGTNPVEKTVNFSTVSDINGNEYNCFDYYCDIYRSGKMGVIYNAEDVTVTYAEGSIFLCKG